MTTYVNSTKALFNRHGWEMTDIKPSALSKNNYSMTFKKDDMKVCLESVAKTDVPTCDPEEMYMIGCTQGHINGKTACFEMYVQGSEVCGITGELVTL